MVTNWLDHKETERLKWPPSSSDVNPSEHLWDEVERGMKKEQPNNEKELKEALNRIWNGIEIPVLKKVGRLNSKSIT